MRTIRVVGTIPFPYKEHNCIFRYGGVIRGNSDKIKNHYTAYSEKCDKCGRIYVGIFENMYYDVSSIITIELVMCEDKWAIIGADDRPGIILKDINLVEGVL